jgi:predicted ATPase
MGEFLPVREHLESAIPLYDPKWHRSLIFRYGGTDVGVVGLSFAALTLSHLGRYPDQALKRGNEALALAQRLSHPFSMSSAGLFGGVLRQYRREARAAQENADGAIALSAEHGFTQFLAFTTSLRGWAIAEQRGTEEGIAQIQEGLAALRETGAELFRPHNLSLPAESYMEIGRLDDGLGALTEALAAADKTWRPSQSGGDSSAQRRVAVEAGRFEHCGSSELL